MTALPHTARCLLSEVQPDGDVELRIEQLPIPALQAGELLVRVDAAPVHPSDLGMLIMAGDVTRARVTGDAGNVRLRLPVPDAARAMMAARAGPAMPAGHEGAGVVIAAGDAEGEPFIGRNVASFAGGMYTDYRVLARDAVMPLPDGATPRDGAAVSVNPLTALAMVEVMRQRGAKALVHTAAASSLGQILQRICTRDGIPLVNIVRRPEQADILRTLGATHVLNSQSDRFMAEMVDAFAQVDASLAFDAVGGGPLAGMILTAMEGAQKREAPTVSPYGSPIQKQVYIYGRLDTSAISIPPTVGMAWGIGGFLLGHFMESAGDDVRRRLGDRVMRELTTTFATTYTQETGLTGLLDPHLLARAMAKATNEKLLLRPSA
jgi:NADPH2:quinone reductase